MSVVCTAASRADRVVAVAWSRSARRVDNGGVPPPPATAVLQLLCIDERVLTSQTKGVLIDEYENTY